MSEIIVKFKDKEIEKISLQKRTLSIGRTPTNDIVIENPAVSQIHAQVKFNKGQFIIEDNKSLNGTFVNGKKITRYILKNGDEVKIGKHILSVKIDEQDTEVLDIPVEMGTGNLPLDAGGTVVLDTRLHRELLERNISGSYGIKTAKIRVLEGIRPNRDILIKSNKVFIGASRKAVVKLRGFLVSRKQAVITKRDTGYVIKHTGGWRKTKVNGRSILEVPLGNNDTIEIAKNRLLFILD